jgi:hypothetical protein
VKVPRFTADASLYKTDRHYLCASRRSFSSVNADLVPQGCGWGKGIVCGALIGTGAVACSALSFYGPAPCFTCLRRN